MIPIWEIGGLGEYNFRFGWGGKRFWVWVGNLSVFGEKMIYEETGGENSMGLTKVIG